MKFTTIDNIDVISEKFIKRFIMSWEEFQIKQKDFIDNMAKNNHLVDFAFYEQSYFWDRIDPKFPRVSMEEALDFVRKQAGPVLYMGEKGEESYHQGKKVFYFISEADSCELAETIEQEWYDSYRLAEQNMYNPDALLPEDLYVFDSSLEWCVVFTHETTDWESEIDNMMKAAESRYCIICTD